MKPKFEAQDAHFSGKRFTLHRAIVEPEGPKYAYHLSDDTTHDSFFVHHVFADIITTRNINNQTIIVKSDNVPTQYKNKYAFKSMQNLSDTYNLRIIWIFDAAGHGKRLIDVISSVGAKSILRQDIVAFYMWFADSKEICSYLTDRTDERMSYSVGDPVSVDASRQLLLLLLLLILLLKSYFYRLTSSENKFCYQWRTWCKNKDVKIIPGCMMGHMFVYTPHSSNVMMEEFLCDCESCLFFNFEKCTRKEEVAQSYNGVENSDEF